MLDFSGMNYWAILIAWLFNIGLGAFWYSPVGFGKLWSKLSGVDILKMKQADANRAIGWVVAATLLQTIVLAVVINSLEVTVFVDAVVTGVVLWFGLTALTTVGNTLYSRQSWKFWWLNASFFLITMTVNSVLFALWR